MKQNINTVNNNLDQLIRKIFALPQDYVLHDSMGPGAIPGWDSLGWISLINSVEKTYHIEFSLDEAAKVRTIGQLSNLIDSRKKSE